MIELVGDIDFQLSRRANTALRKYWPGYRE